MARSKITATSKDVITDDGSILISVIQGEQTRLGITLSWLTSLVGYTLTAKVVEAENSQGSGAIPTDPLAGGNVQTLTIIDTTTTDNAIEIVIPEGLISAWATTPEPDQPIYGYIELEVADAGVGINQQIWKPLRGLVQVRYSPTEAS